MEIGLLVEEVELCAKGLLAWCEVGKSFGLEAWGERFVVQLEFGGEDVDGVPALGKGQACTLIETHQHRGSLGAENDGEIQAIVIGEASTGDEGKRLE